MAVNVTVLMSMVGLATQWGFSLVELTRNQRIADIAAYSAALGYSNSGTTAGMTSAASYIAGLNGGLGTYISASLGTSPRADGNTTVVAQMVTPYQVTLSNSQVSLSQTSYAEIKVSANPCILALNPAGTGITLSGGPTIKANGCTVSSDQSLTVPCGTTIDSDQVTWHTAAPNEGCSNIKPYSASSTTITQVNVADPISGNSEVATARARLSTVTAMSNPSAPSVSGGSSLSFGYSGPLATGTACTATISGSGYIWTVTCPAGGTYNFGSLSVSGGVTVNFDTGGASSTYNFSGLVANNGTKLAFGSGTFNLAAGLSTGGGSTNSFGSGTFNIGKMTSTCGGGNYSICHSGSTLTFAAPVNMTLAGGIYDSSTVVTIGYGSSANVYAIGSAGTGTGIYVGGGGNVVLGDATGTNFSLNGSISTGGGSCLILPAATQHDINGHISIQGAVAMGAGIWTVANYFEAGGGNVTCSTGTAVGVAASNVMMVVGGYTTPTDACSGNAFCVNNGYSSVTITPPASGADAYLTVIGPSSNSAGAGIYNAASTTSANGVFYFPNGPIAVSGTGLGSASSCLELIGTQITVSGGTTLGANCPGINTASGSPSGVRLVQ